MFEEITNVSVLSDKKKLPLIHRMQFNGKTFAFISAKIWRRLSPFGSYGPAVVERNLSQK
jgi:hypothetical protein